jgi:Signal peptidase (SPase) II
VKARGGAERTLELGAQRTTARQRDNVIKPAGAHGPRASNAIGVPPLRHSCTSFGTCRTEASVVDAVECAEVLARRRTLVLLAVAFASVDLTHKLVVHADYHHVRTRYMAFAMVAVITGLVTFVPRVPSRAALLGAAVAIGGALGNLCSLFIWARQGVPDPLVVRGETTGLAFNLADVFAVVGGTVMICAVLIHGMRRPSAFADRPSARRVA